MMYLLDANVFIQAKNLHYGFDFCPGFWAWLDREHANGRIFSIQGVHEELLAGGNDLATWAQGRRNMFLGPDAATIPSLTATSAWASSQQYDPAAVNTFLQVVDYYLVAQAHALEFTVVPHEIPANTTKKIKIPDACIGLGIRHMTPYTMLRSEQARFVLA